MILKIRLIIIYISLSTLAYGNTIKLCSSGAYVGTNKELGINYTMGASVYFKRVNTLGGVKNREIVLESLDDEYNPRKTLFNTLEFLNNSNPLLLFNYVGTPTTNAILPLLKIHEDENLILFGNLTGAGTQRTIPYGEFVFNIRASYSDEASALVKFFLKNNKKRIGVFYQLDDFGRSAYSGLIKELKNSGIELIGEATYSREDSWKSSMKPQATYLKDLGVDAVISIATYEAAASFIRDSRKIGLNIPISNMSFVEVMALLSILEKNKISTNDLYFSQVMPHFEKSSLPVVLEYREEFEKRGLEPNFISLEGYVNAKILASILNGTTEEINRANIRKIIETMEPIDIGIGKELKFTKEKHNLLNSVYIYKTGYKGDLIEVK